MMKKRVCYFTSKDVNDIRVFHKECLSLVKAGYDVTIVCPNAEDKDLQGIHIRGVRYNAEGDFTRFTKLPKLLYKKALEVDADIYHFNDPASIKYGVKLKKNGKKVIFDAFEDHPSLWMERGTGLKRLLYKIIGVLYKHYEQKKCASFDAVICCYHWTKERLQKVNPICELVFNFPIVNNEEINTPKGVNPLSPSICYAGTISNDWNISTIIDAIEGSCIVFNLAGWPADDMMMDNIKSKRGWQEVVFHGKLSKQEVIEEVYNHSDIGIALYHYSPICHGKVGNMSNNKLFEYMLMGMPVICTDFDLWKDVIEKNHCGICVTPNDKNAIRKAIEQIVSHPENAIEMGKNGQRMVLEKYNWSSQEKILLDVYHRINNNEK